MWKNYEEPENAAKWLLRANCIYDHIYARKLLISPRQQRLRNAWVEKNKSEKWKNHHSIKGYVSSKISVHIDAHS